MAMATPAHRRTAAAAVALAAMLVLAVPPSRAVRYGPGDTGVVSVSSEPGFSEGEEPLSVNPRDPDQMTTVANVFEPNFPPPFTNVYGGAGVQDSRVYSTRDGGRHWLTQKLDQGGLGHIALAPGGQAPEFSDAFNILNTDSDSVWDTHGNAYFESGDVHGVYHDGNEVETVWRSTDGGTTWGPPRGYTAVNATRDGTELDRPWLAIDTSGGPHDGRLYTTYETTPFAPIPPEVLEKHSDDHGATWSATVRVDDGTYETQWNPRSRPVVGADGTLYVVYDRAPVTATPFLTYEGQIQLVLARSTDGGATFTRSLIDTAVQRVTSPDEATPAYTEMIPAIATDPIRPGHVAIAWPQALGPSNSRILARYSSDGGAHWSARIDVADDSASRDDQHDHVTLAWLADGRLFVGWRDRRCCGGAWTGDYQQWVRALAPVGSSLSPAGPVVEFSDGPQPPTTSGRGELQPDEFQGLAASSAGVALTWSQLATDGLDHLMFRRVPLSAFVAAMPSGARSTKHSRATKHRRSERHRKHRRLKRHRKHPRSSRHRGRRALA
jgi:hypothetical protein